MISVDLWKFFQLYSSYLLQNPPGIYAEELSKIFWRTCTEDLEKIFRISLIILLHIIPREMAEDISFLFQKSHWHIRPKSRKGVYRLDTEYMVCGSKKRKRKYNNWNMVQVVAPTHHVHPISSLYTSFLDLGPQPLSYVPVTFGIKMKYLLPFLWGWCEEE